MRIGIGYDTHMLAAGRPLILGGTDVPHGKGLMGHSDGDVLVHAVMDALLGAAGQGDIGVHFPDTDDLYKGICSLILLGKVAGILAGLEYEVGNVDAVIVAQEPRLAPHIDAMRGNIACCLGVDVSKINVKATTEEGLGFVGRCEGISAHAVCLLESIRPRL